MEYAKGIFRAWKVMKNDPAGFVLAVANCAICSKIIEFMIFLNLADREAAGVHTD
jgi:hypothetical protein